MRIQTRVMTLASLLALSPIIKAAQYPQHLYINDDWGKLSMGVSMGVVGGESNEYVYYAPTGRKISQLIWKVKPTAIIRGEINYDLLCWLSANVNGWATVAKGGSVLDDYDWLDPKQSHWTNWSHHDNTRTNSANEIDLSLLGWAFQDVHYKIGATAGYQRTLFSFLARGGVSRFDSGASTEVIQYNLPVIGYQQIYNTGYLGLAGKYFTHEIELSTVLKISPWVHSADLDQHYLRHITFTDNGNHSQFYSAELGLGYYFSMHGKIFVMGSYTAFTNGKADTDLVENTTGYRGYFKNAAGLSNENYTGTIGVQYTF